MKRYKKYIQTSKYLDEDSDEIMFDDTIRIDIEVDLLHAIQKVTASSASVKFPGKEQFRQDVINILENDYHFIVIEDVYDGVKQKGHFSDRPDSISLYFDTYFDLINAKDVFERMHLTRKDALNERIFCFINFRFSDHALHDMSDVLHRTYLKENVAKYAKNNRDVTHTVQEESIELDEKDMQYYYDDALEDLRSQLDSRIIYWVRKADQFRRKGIR